MTTWRTSDIVLGGEESQTGGAVDTTRISIFLLPCILVLDQIELCKSSEYGHNNLLNSHVQGAQLLCTVFTIHCAPQPCACLQLTLDTATRCYLCRQPITATQEYESPGTKCHYK